MRMLSSTVCALVLLAAVTTLATKPDTEQIDERRAQSQRTAQVKLVLETERAARIALDQEYRSAPDEAAALAVQKRMEMLARETEWEILGIQAEFLRSTGHGDEAEAIEQAVARMREPSPARPPVNRPRPATTTPSR